MKKIVLGIAITLAVLFTGCGENSEEKAKVEFKTEMLKTEYADTKSLLKSYEEKYGQTEVQTWFQELEKTDEWKLKQGRALRAKGINLNHLGTTNATGPVAPLGGK